MYLICFCLRAASSSSSLGAFSAFSSLQSKSARWAFYLTIFFRLSLSSQLAVWGVMKNAVWLLCILHKFDRYNTELLLWIQTWALSLSGTKVMKAYSKCVITHIFCINFSQCFSLSFLQILPTFLCALWLSCLRVCWRYWDIEWFSQEVQHKNVRLLMHSHQHKQYHPIELWWCGSFIFPSRLTCCWFFFYSSAR